MQGAPEGTRHVVEQISSMLDGIYAAGCGEVPWSRAVARISQIGELDACVLGEVDPSERRSLMLASHGLGGLTTPGVPTPINPLFTDGVLRSSPGAVWQDHEIMSAPLLATTSFWIDWMQPRGFVSWACAIVGRDAGQVICIEVYARSSRTATFAQAVHLLWQLAPHLCRAWRLGEISRATRPRRAAPSPPSDVSMAMPSDRAALPDFARLRGRFGLTKAEARLALRLAEGSSLAGAARAFDVKMTTVRSQLRQVFAKTGTSRQAELVALLLNRGVDHRSPAPDPSAAGSPRSF